MGPIYHLYERRLNDLYHFESVMESIFSSIYMIIRNFEILTYSAEHFMDQRQNLSIS